MHKNNNRIENEMNKYNNLLTNYCIYRWYDNNKQYNTFKNFLDDSIKEFINKGHIEDIFDDEKRFIYNKKLKSSYDIKNSYCDGKFCLSYYPNKTNNKPFAIADGRNIYFNNIDCKHRYCIGKVLKAKNIKLIPNLNYERDNIYISAPSRSGKTWFAKEYAKLYKMFYPNNKIHIFSRKNKDKSIDDIKIIRIPITPNEKYNKEYIINKLDKYEYKNFSNSLCIFDDIENISIDKEIKKKVMKLANEILNIGADHKCSIINISHNIMNYQFTKNIISESQTVVLFPNSGIYKQYEKFNNTYIGLDKKQFKEIMNIDSRWIIFFKNSPITCLTINKIEILNLRK
jgi:hypothetical protein